MRKPKISDKELLIEIHKGQNCTEIAKKYSMTVGAVSKRLKKLLKEELIELDIEETKYRQSLIMGHTKYYHLTDKGRAKLSFELRGDEKELSPDFRGVHNLTFRMKIIEDGDFWFRYKNDELNNIVVEYDWIGDVHIRKITKKNRTKDEKGTIFLTFKVTSETPECAIYIGYYRALKIKKLLERKSHYKLDNPEISGRPKFEISNDPVAKEVSKEAAVITPDYAIDNTPEEGTLHYTTVEDTIAYLEMPRNMQRALMEIENIKTYLANEFSKLKELVTQENTVCCSSDCEVISIKYYETEDTS